MPDFVEKVRVSRAIELLQAKHLRADELATACGFQSVAVLRTAFRDQLGISLADVKEARDQARRVLDWA